MNIINLKIIFRNIIKQRLSNLLSIFVLTVGMASFMLIFFYVQYEKGFDQSWSDADRIYRVNLNRTLANGTVSETANNYSALGWIMADEIPGVEYSTCLWKDKVMAFTQENFIPDARFFWGDESFFKIFEQPFLAGDPQNPFPTIQSMVISESAAKQLFGDEDPIGKSFKLNEGWLFFVSGVFADFPENSHLKIDIIGTFDELFYYINHFDNTISNLIFDPNTKSARPDPSQSWLWNNPNAYTYVKLKNDIDLADATSGFNNIYSKYTANLMASGQKSEFVMQPISSIHTGPVLENELSARMDNRTIFALSVIAILVLIMSWIIFINFQIAQSVERAKEMGLKKVVGALSSDLSFQIILQAVIINVLAMMLAFGVFYILRKQLSDYLELKELVPVDFKNFLWFTAIFLLGSVLSGFYPVLMLVPQNAQRLLSKNFVKNDGFKLRRTLIVVQFAASIGLLVATTVIVRQVLYIKNKDIGLSIKQTAYSYTPMSTIKQNGAAEKLKSFMEEVNRLSFIRNTTLSSSIPGKEINFRSNQISPADEPEKAGSEFGLLCIDEHFNRVYEPQILAGRMFLEDDLPGGNLLVLNRKACAQLGFKFPEEAIGKFVNVSVDDFIKIDNAKYKVCGVIEDFHQESPRKEIQPLLVINDLRWKYDVGFISIAFDQQAGSSMMEALKGVWGRFYPADPFEFEYTSDNYQLQTKADEKLAGFFSAYTALSVLLAILGLLGLVSITTKKRVKEIGIRKVNGAKISEILIMLNKDFVKCVIIAFVIATPVAYYAMYKWLENFAYKTTLSWWIFALAGLLALGIALLTVSFQSWKAATRNPVEALRYE